MEISQMKDKLTTFIKKYRYVILIVLVGVGLMMIPSGKTEEISAVNQVQNIEEKTMSVSEELAQILSQVEGAGNVKVLLTVESGEQVLYQTDEDVSVTSESSSSTQVNTVIVTGTDRGETGLIKQTNPPVYKGAIVVCQGADDPRIQLAIVNAVSNVTGLGADRISVLKMK